MLRVEDSETGSTSRSSAAPQSARNVFFGTWLIASARRTVIARIMTPPVTLICRRLIPGTSFQFPDDLPKPLDLLGGEFFSAQQRGEQLVGRTVIDLVDEFIRLRLLHR